MVLLLFRDPDVQNEKILLSFEALKQESHLSSSTFPQ